MKKVLTIIFVSIIAVTLTGCGCSKKDEVDNSNINIDELPDIKGNENISVSEDGTKVNNSSEFSTTKKYESYEITDAKISTSSDGRTTFTANVKNIGSSETTGTLVNIILVDKKGNKVSKLSTYIRALKSNETMSLNAGIDKDLSNAYNFYFEQYQK